MRGTTTDSAGAFTLVVPDKGSYLLRVSYVGYTTAFTPVHVNPMSPDTIRLGEIKLQSTDNTLRTATVTGVAARVEQKEDTTMFNASAYRVPEGSSLEALVKQLPGVEVSDDGKITWNGKEVKELLVNGKDFFKGDTKVAMKNLPVEVVNRIKAYDKASDYTELTGIDDGEETTVLDISTKRQLNESWVTNADLAYGTEKRYSGKFFVNRCTDQGRITLFGSANNVGSRGFGGPRGFTTPQGLIAQKEAGMDFSWENGKQKKEAGRFEIGGNVRYSHTSTDLVKTTASDKIVTTNIYFYNTLFKSSGEDDTHFFNNVWAGDPKFYVDRDNYVFDYRLNDESDAIGKADRTFIPEAARYDRYGEDRFAREAVDLGAYVWVPAPAQDGNKLKSH